MQKVPQNIMEHLEHVTEEIIRLKKEIMKLEIGDREKMILMNIRVSNARKK